MSRARPVLTEDSLTAHLRRRVEAQPLLGSRREDLVQLIVAGAAAERAGRFRWSLPRRWLAPALAGGLLMLVLLALAAQLPRPVDLPPGGQAQHVLTPAELAELRQARATGMVVADISAAHVGRSMAECNGRSPCLLIVLDGVAPIVDFDIIGVEEIDTSRPAALALLDGEIEYIGPVEIKPGGFAWPVTDVAAMDEPADELHVVEGWLVQSGPHSCPAPPNIGVATPTPETGAPVRALLDYWCPASWLTAEHETLATVDDSGNMTGRVRPRGDQVQVQTGAYGEFADPQMIVYGRDAAPLPSHGHYLVRPAGCPAAAWSGQCPVWQMVGRLGVPADDGTPTTPLPEPQTPAPSAGTALHVVATVEEWCGSIGGCRYYAELDGPEDEWRAQIDVGNLGQKSTIGGQEEWPAHLPPGDYTIRMISYHMSDAIVVGQPRPLGPVAARCQAQFTVTDEPSVVAGGVFRSGICFISFADDLPGSGSSAADAHLRTVTELIGLLGSRASLDRVVLVTAAAADIACGAGGCGELVLDQAKHIAVTGLATAEALDGSVAAFRITGPTSIEYIDRVTFLDRGRGTWTVHDVLGYRGEGPLGLLPVDGWLIEGAWGESAQPAWITPGYYQASSVTSEGDTVMFTVRPPVEALTVQPGAYWAFAPDARVDDQRLPEPRRAIYLVRPSGGCRADQHVCPYWEVVGTLRAQATTDGAAPSPAPSAGHGRPIA
jgi:hypothetical protein